MHSLLASSQAIRAAKARPPRLSLSPSLARRLRLAGTGLLLMLLLGASASFAQPGPRLTDAQLFDALNLDYPGLATVRSNVLATNYPAAKASLTSYLQTRTNVDWFFDWHQPNPAVSYSRTTADQATNGTVNQIGYPYTFPGGDIDWFYNYTTNLACSCARNNEWQWTLNRMSQWSNLGRTYWGTRDESYARHWGRQLRDWIADCPVVASRANGSPSTWRTIESGIRMGSVWPEAFFRFVLSPSLTNEEHILYLKSSVEHARYLRTWFTSENFLTMEMNGLFAVGTIFPELKEAAEWRSFAAQTLRNEQFIQFLPDGVHNELTPRYHGVSVDNIAAIYDLAAINGRLAELPADFLAGLERSFQFYAAIATPERTTPAFNDSSRENCRSWLATGLTYFPTRAEFQWFASNGATGAPPAYTSTRFPYAGYGVMRSGWETNANYLCFDGGALGYSGHRHEDKLNVVLWAHGREFLLDNGGGPYDQSIWRTWGFSSYSHNTATMDGLDQEGGDGSVSLTDPDYVAQAPVDLRWESDASHDFAAATFSRGWGNNYQQRPATHTRRVLFVKPDLFVIADTLIPTNAASHTYQARWHLRTTNTTYFAGTKVVTTADAGRPNLAVVPCLGSGLLVTNVSAQTSASGPGVTNLAEILGWDLPSTSISATPAATVTHTLSGTSTQQFLTLFVPMATGAANPVASVSNASPGTADVWLNDGRHLLLAVDANPARGLRFVEVLPGGVTNRLVGAGFAPPVFSGVTNRAMNPNTTKWVAFGVSDPDGPASNVVLSATSLQPALVPPAGLSLAGQGTNRTLTITPAPDASGVATIRLLATDPDGSTLSTDFTVTINTPPATNGATPATVEGQPVDFDLRALLLDDLTPADNWQLALGAAQGGSAFLLADGHTVHFEAAANFSGDASLAVLASDFGFDPRWLLYFSCEAPDDLTDGAVADASDSLRDGQLWKSGAGSATFAADTPGALGLANRRSLRLTESSVTNAACLRRVIPTNEFNFSDHDWSFAGWFKRAAQTNDDFIFYLGNGDGFGANEDFQLYAAGGSDTLALRHYVGEATTDLDLAVGGLAADQWHHAALTFARTNAGAGRFRLYVNGSLAAEGASAALKLDQSVPVVFGGHNRTNARPERWFNGWLDDLVLFDTALTAPEVAQLATRSAGHLAGLTATNLITVRVRDVNDPPEALPGNASTPRNQSLDVDLRLLATDLESPAARLRFAVGPATNGSVTLLADGFTARFTPAAGYEGAASFAFTVTDTGVDPRLVLHYGFELPDATTDAQATDSSAHERHGTLEAISPGSLGYVTNAPPALAAFEPRSLLLTESGTNGAARLHRALSPMELDLSDHDWTFSGWFRRASQTNDDFLFYVGTGDGFGSNEELQLFGLSGQPQVGLRHYIGENTTDVNLAAGGVTVGGWRHVAVTFERTNTRTGFLRLYVNGTLAGTATPSFHLDQSAPVVFGGHASRTAALTRWANGNLDDLALFAATLSASEVARLATGTVAHFGGLTATGLVAIAVGSPNLPPVFPALSNRTVIAGATLQVPVSAYDPDTPAQRLRFALLSAPPGAVLNATNGAFSWRPPAAHAAGNYLVTLVASEAGWQTDLAPVADATVRDGSFANASFGTDTNLVVKLSASAGLRRESYLRFDLGAVTGSLAEATLRLMPWSANAAGTQAVALVTNDAWSEATLTWNNQPGSEPAFTTWAAPTPGTAVGIPLVPLAQAALAGDRLLSLRLFATNTTSDGLVNYGSKEGAPAGWPQLSLVATNASSLSTTQGFWITVVPPVRPTFATTALSNGLPLLWIQGDAGPDYLLERSTKLAASAWQVIATQAAAQPPFALLDESATNAAARFYRLRLGP